MPDHPEDQLQSEEFTLDEEIDASALSALFADSAPGRPPSAQAGESLIELEDEGDAGRPGPAFGTLAPGLESAPSLDGPPSVFEPLTREEQRSDEDLLPPIPYRPRPAPQTPVSVEEYSNEDYVSGEKKLTWRDRLAIAKNELNESGPPKVPRTRGRNAAEPPSAALPDERLSPETAPRLTLRQRLALARTEAARPADEPPEFSDQAGDDDETPIEVHLHEPEAPVAAAAPKLTLRQRYERAKDAASSPQDKDADSGELPEGDASLVDIASEEPVAGKLSLRERIAHTLDKRGREGAGEEEQDLSAEEAAGAAPELWPSPEPFPEDAADAGPPESLPKSEGAPVPGRLAKARAFWAEKQALAAQAEAPKKAKASKRLAGADVSAPSGLERARERFRPKPTPAVRASRFAELLTPLSKAELTLLQQDVQQDTPLFVAFERSRRLGATRQRLGFVIGLLATVWFFVKVGLHYPTLLANAAKAYHPAWLHLAASNHDIFNGVWVGFGLLLPLLAGLILAEAINYLWRGLSDWRIDDVLLGCIALICAGGIYRLLIFDESAIAALGFAVVWLLVRGLVRLLQRLIRGRDH